MHIDIPLLLWNIFLIILGIAIINHFQGKFFFSRRKTTVIHRGKSAVLEIDKLKIDFSSDWIRGSGNCINVDANIEYKCPYPHIERCLFCLSPKHQEPLKYDRIVAMVKYGRKYRYLLEMQLDSLEKIKVSIKRLYEEK